MLFLEEGGSTSFPEWKATVSEMLSTSSVQMQHNPPKTSLSLCYHGSLSYRIPKLQYDRNLDISYALSEQRKLR
jgi:hypothetical protein